MTQQLTKTQQVAQHIRNDEWDKAFTIAGKFRRLGRHKDDITRAVSARQNPDFYKQIGKDLVAIEHRGQAALKCMFIENEGNPNK